MTQRKKLIEVALPLEAINVASAREKSIRHGHPSTLHLWWARRPLAAARAVIFASLVDDPDSPDAPRAFVDACRALPVGANVHANGDTPRMRLFDFIERLVTWEATTDEAILNTARALIRLATDGNPPPLLDPFAGGGSIPLEAQRLGLEAHASDLNPVAVMINKAQIEIPPRFANLPPVNPRDRKQIGKETWRGAAGLAADVRYYGEWMREKAWERIGHLYPTHNGETVIAWIWARTVKSPNPAVNAHVPLVRSFILSKKKGQTTWVEPIVESTPNANMTHRIRYIVRREQDGYARPTKDVGTIARQGGECIITGSPMPLEYIRSEGRAGNLGSHLIAIVTEGSRTRNYHSPDNGHEMVATGIDEPNWKPTFETSSHPQYMAAYRYGMTTFADLFTSRQLVAMSTFSNLIAEARALAFTDAHKSGLADNQAPLQDGGRGALAYAEAISVYLALAVGRLSERGCSLASWQNSANFVRGVFARQAISMVWDFAEVNPFSGSSGNFYDNIEWVAKATESIKLPDGNSHSSRRAKQSDATLTGQIDFHPIFSTDPPYYDSVPYADLSDFFYVWMRPMLGSVYPEIFNTVLVPKSTELVADHQRYGGRSAANEHFENGMFAVFAGIRKVTDQAFPVTVYYAFKQTDNDQDEDDSDDGTSSYEETMVASSGWETILQGLIASGFSIIGTWPVRTERASRTRGLGSNALASSIVLVCRPRLEDAPTTSRRAFLDALRRELPAALAAMQSGNIAPVDLAQASIGPGMAIYSRYSQVLEADGSPMSVRTALGLINAALDEYLAEQDGDIDADTRFAVDWFSQMGFNEGGFGVADVLARAKNTSVDGVKAAGLVLSERGKVRLKHWSEYDPGAWDPAQDKRATVWEATHHLIERLNTHGETGSALLMTKMPSAMAAEARQLAYRLYSICERKGWAEHARDYNALVVSWSEIGDRAAALRNEAAAGDRQQQTGLPGFER